MAGESLLELLEAVKREYGAVPRPAEALAPAVPTPTPTHTVTLTPEQREKIKEALETICEALARPAVPTPTPTPSIAITPEQREKIKEALETIWEIEKRGIKKAIEFISKVFEKYRKEKQLAEATGQPVDIEKVLREAGIEVYKPELGIYVK
jgi:hypothetical protein